MKMSITSQKYDNLSFPYGNTMAIVGKCGKTVQCSLLISLIMLTLTDGMMIVKALTLETAVNDGNSAENPILVTGTTDIIVYITLKITQSRVWRGGKSG